MSMGYHSNELTTKKAVNDAQRFINDRSRLEHGLRIALKKLGASDLEQDKIVSDIKASHFDSITAIKGIINEKPTY
jgi:SOS response regulatory protein OraA/RecX